MKHRRTVLFKALFKNLPADVRAQAKKQFRLFAKNRTHPSLNVERVKGYPGVWSGRVSRAYRWTFHFEEDEQTGDTICVHRVIGKHQEVYRKP